MVRRLMVKGVLQRPGIDFEDTFASVAKLSTVRVVLVVAVLHGSTRRKGENRQRYVSTKDLYTG